MQKGSYMSQNNQRTRAFETVDNSANESRRKVVIAIFVVIALILASFATLIIGKIVSKLPDKPYTPSNNNLTYIPKEAADIKIGNLLSISDSYTYVIPSDFSNMVNLYQYRKNSDNVSKVEINGCYTYSLSLERIALEKDTLDAFNRMILDYCNTIDLKDANVNCASNVVIGWGGYNENTIDEYETDLSSASTGKEYYDHILGTTLALRRNNPSESLSEEILKKDFEWIYNNLHKYGFIIRYPNACKNHTGFDSSKRVHLRYIGVEHATYIHQNNICFEEYLELLRNQHNSPEKALNIQVADASYLVYYIKYTGNPTSIPVPKNATYTISGDNMNGFIVTVEK